MKHTLSYFGLYFNSVPIKCDNTSAIDLTKNPIQHSRTKHIDIKHYFIRDLVQKGDVSVEYVCTNDQLANIFIKALPLDRFEFLKSKLGILCVNRSA